MNPDDFPDKKEVDATRIWYYETWAQVLAILLTIVMVIIAIVWLIYEGLK